ncbi:LOW QUALITY PROTEIN: low-density lipoprotein receptor class A domain-containing protein 4-like, partial [Brachyistius frenatus]|uniref:LOW QUALITY PROTEIN: low-density lipoprotein receptor class A domain-containing protein 4-like n=1 Tax=Brachyistius frenatus TaxID=100188 RepID=UPI0037E95E63
RKVIAGFVFYQTVEYTKRILISLFLVSFSPHLLSISSSSPLFISSSSPYLFLLSPPCISSSSPYFFLLSPLLPPSSQVLYAPQARDRFSAPSFMQRDRFSRFQPTYPYLQHQIDLPPTISLSDGEEPPPYQGPCTLQLRDPEQQMELNRESVRAPPNRTIYDSDLIDMGGGGSLGGVVVGGLGGVGPRPPSSNSGISAANSSSHGRMEGPPPAYSEVMGHYPGSAFYLHQHSNNQREGRPGGPGSRTIQQQSQSESTTVPAKDGQPEDLV